MDEEVSGQKLTHEMRRQLGEPSDVSKLNFSYDRRAEIIHTPL